MPHVTCVIGDIHGQYRALRALLKQIDFSPSTHRLWFVGDLVNRGPQSHDVLQFVYDHQDVCTVVLGNHEMYLLACALGIREADDAYGDIARLLKSSNIDTLVAWLLQRPVMHEEHGWRMLHAAVWPWWDHATTKHLAESIHQELTGLNPHALLTRYQRKPSALDQHDLAFALRVFTKMRLVDPTHRQPMPGSMPPEEIPAGSSAWYHHVAQHGLNHIFGHWAATGLRVMGHAVALDSGAGWGRTLSAYALETGEIFQVNVT